MGTMGAPLDTVVRVRLSERRSATQEGSVGGKVRGKSSSFSGNSRCKGPEVGMTFCV